MSLRRSTWPVPAACSGGMYAGVPIASPVSVSLSPPAALTARAIPKSVTIAWPPENIMLSGGHAIVTDFGIARAVSAAGGDKLTETGLAIGTPAYMPPEQAAGTGQVDRRSDIYSLACVLYETLAGQHAIAPPTAQHNIAR